MAKWTKLETLPGGLRLFSDARTNGRVAIADQSGVTPDLTHDGVLWLDATRPISIGREHVSLPLLDTLDRPQVAFISVPDLPVLADKYGMAVEIAGRRIQFLPKD